MDGDEYAVADLQLADDWVRTILVGLWILGCVALSVQRIPAFSSDRALWGRALPSDRPRVAVNYAAALIRDGEPEIGAIWSVRAVELAERPSSAYEREAVAEIVRRQLNYINILTPICDRPFYRLHC